MITLTLAIAETPKGMRFTLDRIADDVHTKTEVQAMHVLYALIYSLARKVAADYKGRFLRLPPIP